MHVWSNSDLTSLPRHEAYSNELSVAAVGVVVAVGVAKAVGVVAVVGVAVPVALGVVVAVAATVAYNNDTEA